MIRWCHGQEGGKAGCHGERARPTGQSKEPGQPHGTGAAIVRAAEQGQSPQDTGERRRLGGTTSYFTWTAERTDRNATWVTTNTATSTGGGPTTPNATVLIPVKDTTGHKTTGQLSEPVIAIYFEEGTCNIMLTCTTREGGGDVKYSWQQPGKSHVLSKEPVLHITQKPDDDFLNYTCTICRGESQNSSTVSLSEHCHGASASSSIKYWVPPAFMVIALITLYFTYRKTTERASRSRAGSIDQSSGKIHSPPSVLFTLCCAHHWGI
ncbi:hypothetical protein KIL84_005757 [Mauremys mutica]|uniref:Ig-like domain-containing protein n=1 Tax=Mauremys mutica TaxID=74926 RepID=A0A9D3XGV7_9SAUR|nr:hypothetical protein KIL84_005757 [Mauremys mutica]